MANTDFDRCGNCGALKSSHFTITLGHSVHDGVSLTSSIMICQRSLYRDPSQPVTREELERADRGTHPDARAVAAIIEGRDDAAS